MTLDEIVAAIQAAQAKNSKKFTISTATEAKVEGLYVRDVGNGYIKLQYFSAAGIPKRIPGELRETIGLGIAALAPLANWKNFDIVEYSKSNDTQRRIDTIKSVLQSALTTTDEPAAIRSAATNDVVGWTSKIINVETWGGEFPERPALADLGLLDRDHTERIPKFVSFVRISPTGGERVILLTEAPVGPDGKRADAVSIHYKMTDAELAEAKIGKMLRGISASSRRMVDVHIHVGDINRPLGAEGQGEHFAKTIKYVELVIGDLLKSFRGEKFELRGEITLSMADGYFHSVHYLLDTATGTMKPARDAIPVAEPPKTPGAIPVDGAPQNVDLRLKAIRVTLKFKITSGPHGPTTQVDINGHIMWIRAGVLPEVKELQAALADLPKPVRDQIGSLIKVVKMLAATKGKG